MEEQTFERVIFKKKSPDLIGSQIETSGSFQETGSVGIGELRITSRCQNGLQDFVDDMQNLILEFGQNTIQ